MCKHSRRTFLARILGAAWFESSILQQAQLRAAQARAESKREQPTLFDLERTAEGVYAAIARPRTIINSNAVIFENTRDLLIVDAHSAPSAASALVAQIRREITTKPVRYVVATHMHGDHTQGLPGYKSLAPRVEIVASEKTRVLAADLNPGRLKAALEGAPRSIETYRKRLEEAKTAEEKAHYGEMIAQTQAFLAEMRNTRIELPTLTFDRQLTIHDEAHDIHLAFCGRGHTAGDIVAVCPQKRVIASGDLVHGFFPTIGDGYPREWPATLDAVGRFEFEHVIGGHGGVQHTRAHIGHLHEYLTELTEAVLRRRQEGLGLKEIQKTVTPASLKSLSAADYGEYLVDEIKQHDFRVQLLPKAEILARGVRDNIASVLRTVDRA